MTVTRAGTLAHVALAVLVLTACGNDDGPARPLLARVSSQPCSRPTARTGLAVQVAPGVHLTAAHVVDGPVRRTTVGERPAGVIAVDAASDLALLATDDASGDAPLRTADADAGDRVTVLMVDGEVVTSVERVVVLEVDDVTAGSTSTRRSIVLRGAVDEGTSGAPVLDRDGALVGVVTLVDRDDDLTYATARPHVDALIASAPATPVLDPTVTCS